MKAVLANKLNDDFYKNEKANVEMATRMVAFHQGTRAKQTRPGDARTTPPTKGGVSSH